MNSKYCKKLRELTSRGLEPLVKVDRGARLRSARDDASEQLLDGSGQDLGVEGHQDVLVNLQGVRIRRCEDKEDHILTDSV